MKEFIMKHKVPCILGGIAAILIFAIYLFALFLPGYWYRDAFLYKKSELIFGELEVYSGHDAINSVDYEMTMVKDGIKTYIAFTVGETERGYEIISDNTENYYPDVEIYENGEIVFKGISHSGLLIDENDELFVEEPVMNYYTGDTLSEEELLPTYNWLYDVSQRVKPEIRGDVVFLPAIIIVAACVIFDMLYPDFFWELKHCLDVDGGRPSDFYRLMQKLGWILSPFVIIILMISSFVVGI